MSLERNLEPQVFPVEALTHREIEILGLYAAGFNTPEVAGKLYLAGSTIKWYARQINSKLGVSDREAAIRKARSLGFLAPDPISRSLPAPLSPMMGRLDELRAVKRALADPGCRLLTITGPGGIGKTRLAIQTAVDAASQPASIFPDGVFFVRSEPVSSPITAIADVLQLHPHQKDENIRSQLLGYLQRRRMLFLLDNFENYVGTPEALWLVELLINAPNVKLLVTSRTRLNLAGEQVFPLSGLDLPAPEEFSSRKMSLNEVSGFSSIQLFLQAARRTRPSFQLAEENVEFVLNICRRIEGMPLGIELAAGWVGVLSPQEIQKEMENSLDFLETPLQGVPDRQRSLRAVFESSWRRLSEPERAAASRLVIFQGGFDYPAARHISGLSPKMLLTLVSKSWIQMEGTGRYRFYDPLRAYIQEIAMQEAGWEMTNQDHSDYFCSLAAVEGPRLRSFSHVEAVERFRSEKDNLLTAWYWAAGHCRWSLIEQALDGLCTYFKLHGRYGEGAQVCSSAVEAMKRSAPEGRECLLAHLLTWQAAFIHDPNEAGRLLEQAQKMLEDSSQRKDPSYQSVQAFLWQETGQLASRQDRQKALPLFRKSLDLYQKLGNEQGAAEVMSTLGWINWSSLDLDAAEKWLETSLEIQKRTGDDFFTAKSLNMLGLIVRNQGRYQEAERLQREALERFRALGSHPGLAEILCVLPFTLLKNGKAEEAEKCARESLAEYTHMGYEGPASAKPYVPLSCVLSSKGNYPMARAAAQEGLSLAQKHGNRQETGYLMLQLGKLDLLEGRSKPAQQYFLGSYQAFSALNHKSALLPLAYLAYLSADRGEAEDARRMMSQAVTMAAEGKDAVLAFDFLLPAIIYLDSSGRRERAIEFLIFIWQYEGFKKNQLMNDLLREDLLKQSMRFPASMGKEELDAERGLAVREKLEGIRMLVQ